MTGSEIAHRPRVSVVTPVYNDERYVAEMMASVRGQTFSDWEHILVDDGSTDASAEIIEAVVANDPRVRLLRQENTGQGIARNRGLALAGKSDFVLFLDHDDVLEPNMLETMVGYLDDNPTVGVVYCDVAVIDEHGESEPHSWRMRFRGRLLSISHIDPEDPEMPFESLLMWGGILPSNALIRRPLYDEAGGFDPAYYTDDTDVFMRLGLKTSIHYLNRPLVRYRRHANQMSVDTDATSAELDRLLREKWARADLSPGDRRRFERGMNLRRYGADALVGFSHAVAEARKGRLLPAARFFGGALRRYLLYVGANLGLIRTPA